MDNFENGLGKNRQFGFDKEDGPNKRSLSINSILDKLEAKLRSRPDDNVLKKCQTVLDKLADDYSSTCTKKQLSRMYKIQSRIYIYSGEKKLYKKYKYQASEVRKDHALRRDIFIAFVIIGILTTVICFFIGQEDSKRLVEEKLKKCLDNASAAALFYDNSKDKQMLECYKEYKTEESEKKIKELQESIDHTKAERLKEEQKREDDEKYLKQYMLEEEKKKVYCNTTYNGFSADTYCH